MRSTLYLQGRGELPQDVWTTGLRESGMLSYWALSTGPLGPAYPPSQLGHPVLQIHANPMKTEQLLLVALLLTLPSWSGCSCTPQGGVGNGRPAGGQRFLSMGTAPVGGAFPVVGNAIAEVLNAHADSIDWKVNTKGTKGSQENIRRLSQGGLDLALSNAAITYFAVRGEASWEQKYEMRAIATLAPNVAMFITRADSGINGIADLKGKQVVVGPAGAGFEMFVRPLVTEHGLSWDDFQPQNANQSAAVDMLGDGSVDAAFLGGAVPTASIAQATSTFDVRFIPFDESARQRLIKNYPFFHPASVPAGTYKGLESDFAGLNVGSMHLITSADQDDELIYLLTKTIWENRAEIAAGHPAGKAINEKNVTRNTGTDFHPGAIRFYKEIGLWQADETAAASTP